VAVALAAAAPDLAASEVRYERALYAGGRTELVDLVQAVADEVATVLVVGHNPTITDVSLLLRRPDEAGSVAEELRTSGLAVHRVDGPWASCEPGTTELLKRHTARA
jgi:phosphohistidine phosphatase